MDGLYICENLPFEISWLSTALGLTLSIQGFQPGITVVSTHYAVSAIRCVGEDTITLRSALKRAYLTPPEALVTPITRRASRAPSRRAARRRTDRPSDRSSCRARRCRRPRTPSWV